MNLNKLLSQMSLELADLETPENTVETVTQYARIAVDADDAGVMLVHARDRIETPVATSREVDRAHQLQGELGEGPCLAAVYGGDEIYVVKNTLGDDRWPNWGKAAADLGYFSSVSASLETGSQRIGSLNVYARNPNAFGDDDAEAVGFLAGHASVAIAASRSRHDLHKAIGTRTTIGQAQGILMKALDIDSETAFAYMRRLSQDQNVKLAKIAESIVENRSTIGTDTGV